MSDPNSQSVVPKRKPFKWTQVQDKQGIISDASMGLSQAKIAEKWGVSRATVARILKEFKQACPQAELSKDLSHYRENLKGKAIKAVESGLDDPSDNYKRGNLGVAVLKGIGEFDNDSQAGNANLNILLANMPPSMFEQARKAGCFVAVPEAEVIEAEESTPQLRCDEAKEEPA